VSSSLGWAIFGTELPIFSLSSGVYSLLHLASRRDRLGACRAADCFPQCVPHVFVRDMNFLPREREESDTVFSWEYTHILLEVLIQCIIAIYLGSQLARVAGLRILFAVFYLYVFPCLFVCLLGGWFVCPMCNIYVMYIVAMRLHSS